MPTVDVRPDRQPGVPPCHGAAVRAGGWSAGVMPRPTRPARARSGSEGPSSSVRRRGLTPGAESVVRLPSCVGSRSSPDSAGRIVRRSGVLSCKLLISKRAPVAQLDRASASGAEGHRFESCRARQLPRPFSPRERAFFLGFSALRRPCSPCAGRVRNGQNAPQKPPREHQKLSAKLAAPAAPQVDRPPTSARPGSGDRGRAPRPRARDRRRRGTVLNRFARLGADPVEDEAVDGSANLEGGAAVAGARPALSTTSRNTVSPSSFCRTVWTIQVWTSPTSGAMDRTVVGRVLRTSGRPSRAPSCGSNASGL